MEKYGFISKNRIDNHLFLTKYIVLLEKMKGFGIFSQIFLVALLLVVIFSSAIKQLVSVPFCSLNSINPLFGRVSLTIVSMMIIFIVLKIEESFMPSNILQMGKSINLVMVFVGGVIVYFFIAGRILKC